MADELSALTAVPLEVDSGGKRYRFSPLTIRQTAELRAWARNKPFEDLRARLKALGDVVSKDDRAQLYHVAESNSLSEPIVNGYLDGPEGTAKAFELMVRVNHPDIADAELSKLLSPEVEARVWRWLREVTAPIAKEDAQPKKGEGGDGKK